MSLMFAFKAPGAPVGLMPKSKPTSFALDVPNALSYSVISIEVDVVVGLIQPSIVIPLPWPTSRFVGEDGLTNTKLFTPFRLNAMPTSPLVKPVPFSNIPLLLPMMSLALPSAGHQLTKPVGSGSQGGGGLTVRVALELSTVSTALLTTTA